MCCFTFARANLRGQTIRQTKNHIIGGIFMEDRLEILRAEIDKLIYEKQPEKIRFFIEHLYSVARYCSLLSLKRNLNQEIAMISVMLHDIANVNSSGSGAMNK
jgi:HD superfamily phosphodiesterase